MDAGQSVRLSCPCFAAGKMIEQMDHGMGWFDQGTGIVRSSNQVELLTLKRAMVYGRLARSIV